MLLSVLVYVQNLKWALPMSLMLGSAPIFTSLWTVWRLMTTFLPKRCYNYGDCVMYSLYQRMVIFFVEHYSGIQVFMYGDVDSILNKKENVIYISNHQCTVDWFIADILAVRQGSLGDIRYILKNGLKYLPVYGFYFGQHGGIYISRGDRFQRDKAVKDLKYFRRTKFPLWLVIFPEGTRYNPENSDSIEESQAVARDKGLEVLTQVLTPRVKATHLSIETLCTHVDALYDITVAYGNTYDAESGQRTRAPSITDVFSGCCKEIHIHMRRLQLDSIPIDEDGLRHWLHQRFVLKNRLLKEFYSPANQRRTFPGECQERPLSLWETLPSALLFSGMLAMTLSSPQGRAFYWKAALGTTMAGYLWAATVY